MMDPSAETVSIRLIKAVQRDPFNSIGKPEPLKHQLNRKQ
jgi:Txe/YoeB family toxin of Txe-Axe toxin-antitoxin module